MNYIFLQESPFKRNFRAFAWEIFKCITVNDVLLNENKINEVYNILLKFFTERAKVNFPNYNEYIIKNKATQEYILLLHRKITDFDTIRDFVNEFDKYKHLLVIKTS